MRAAQLQAREPRFACVPSGPAAGSAKAVGSGTTRPYATMRPRQRARVATSPWQMSRFVSGLAAMRSQHERPSAAVASP